ncbi:MAG: peptide ABC transporter ATP-binding protein [Actinobacteria bacterium 13_2_20CM_2_71_6]|nr:MAG: peptide ABC transporter ATP-binding protein [Actinobacteria bacterium 13_2_20CM_2_71_6]
MKVGTPTKLAVSVRGLRVDAVASRAAIVDEVDLDVRPGQILGLVGESGSGKTTLGLALLSYHKRGTRNAGGAVVVGGTDLNSVGARAIRRLRGRRVAYIPQSPGSALNPNLRVGIQLRECLPGKDSARVREVLREVALPDTDEFLARYPHQLSGGQQQRVVIAMAFIGRPDLIVLDEPTTGLDVTTQKHVLDTVRQMCAMYACAAVYISHDMAVVAELADRIAVMYSGRIVESGPAEDVLRTPRHPYTTRLLMAVPDLDGRREMRGVPGQAPAPARRPPGCAFAPRCPIAVDRCRAEAPPAEPVGPAHLVRCFRAGVDRLRVVPRTDTAPPPSAETILGVRHLIARYGSQRVLDGIDLDVPRGTCVALLGESGSGKTTLSRSIAGLHRQYDGDVLLDGKPLAHSSFARTVNERRRVQYVFQNPYESLNPRKTVRELVLGPARVLLHRIPDPERLVADALEQVTLRPDLADRYPDQLSGGERQRVAIARALVTRPDVLICDEVTSAIVEHGAVATVLDEPAHAYTRSLVANTPHFRLAAS